ncbi:MAG: hypothetical protein MR727_13200 [Lentisphaeria bacterium]|nr:hypothetical protein [Lentisphaeria bacterium]
MKPRITIAEYPESEIPERYFDCRSGERMCVKCTHFTARCDLRKDKRYIVPPEHGKCSLKKVVRTCSSYERIPELRAANMNPAERFYHHMYTRKYLQKVLRCFFHDPEPALNTSKNHRCAEEWTDMIVAYEKMRRERLKNEAART